MVVEEEKKKLKVRRKTFSIITHQNILI